MDDFDLDDPSVHEFLKPADQAPVAAAPAQPPLWAQVADTLTGNVRTDEGVTPTTSPIDLIAGGIGSRLGSAMASGSILANEAGEIAPGGIQQTANASKAALDAAAKSGTTEDIAYAAQKANRDADFVKRLADQTKERKASGFYDRARPWRDKYVSGGEVVMAEGGEVNLDSPQVADFVSSPRENVPILSQLPPNNVPIDESGHDSVLDSPEVNSYLAQEKLQDKYGSPSQQAIAGLEGVAKGVAGPLATAAELGLGMTTPEAIRGREAANPTTHGIGEATGFLGSAVTGVGEAALLGKAAEGLGLGAKAGGALVNQIGADAIKGAFETALFQGGEEIHKAFVQDPAQTAESAISDIGLAGVMGGVFGGALGAGLRSLRPELQATEEGIIGPGNQFVSELDKAKMEAGDFETSIKHSSLLKDKEKETILAGLGREKPDAPEIKAAADRLGAPVLEGMISDSKLIRKADDLLINGPPTYSGIRRQALYKEGHDIANGTVNEVLGEGSQLSKAEVGKSLQDSITKKFEEQNAPIKAMYDELKAGQQNIPLPKNSAEDLINELKSIKELNLAPSSPEGQMARRVINEIPNIKTVDDVKAYKSILGRSVSPTASPGEKRMASIIGDKLKELEEGATESFAKSSANTPEAKARILNLIEQRKMADAQYKPFIKDVQALSEQLGKGRIHGVQDAINFINERLSPEEITTKLFSKRDSEFLKFFEKKFPEQMELMRNYQKGVLREEASKSGTLSPKVLFNKVNKLEPEIQKSLFTKEELSKLKDAETYLRSMPENFNPSGTAHMEAFKDFFKHPVGAALANAQAAGMEAFVKLAGHLPEITGAKDLAKASISGWNTASKAVRSVFSTDLKMPASIAVSEAARDKLKKLVSEYSADPQKMLQLGANNPVPSYATAFAATSGRAVQYLSSLKPNTDRRSPLDSKPVPTPDQVAKYNRALDLAQNPNLILKSIKEGNLRPTDIQTIRTIYPAYYKQLSTKLTDEMIKSIDKGNIIPYRVKMALSMFAAQPLESSLRPESIVSAQSAFAPKQNQPQPGASNSAGVKRGTASLNKVSNQYQTATQNAERDRLRK